MRRMRSARIIIAGALWAGCLGGGHRRIEAPSVAPELRAENGAMVLTASILQRESRPLIEVLRARVPSLRIVDADPCPEVLLRGRSTIVTSSNPAIYLDGQRANDTCLLEMLDALNLERVEIYPSGIPRRGYVNDPYGVILIFSRTAERRIR